MIRDPIQLVKDGDIKNENGVGAEVKVPTASGKRKRKLLPLGSPEKKIKKRRLKHRLKYVKKIMKL